MLQPIEIVPGEVDWWNYFLCGIKGVLEDRAVSPDTVIGMDCFVEGQIPPRAGLSSSSALVVSAAIGIPDKKNSLGGECFDDSSVLTRNTVGAVDRDGEVDPG